MLISIWKVTRNFRWVQHCTPSTVPHLGGEKPFFMFCPYVSLQGSLRSFHLSQRCIPHWPLPAPRACRTTCCQRGQNYMSVWATRLCSSIWHMDLQLHACPLGWWPYTKDIQHDWQSLYCILHHSRHSSLCTNSHTGACKLLQAMHVPA